MCLKIMINSKKGNSRPKINMITKKLSKRQIIVPIRANNAKTIIKNANKHIFNINKSLKGAESDTITDFI